MPKRVCLDALWEQVDAMAQAAELRKAEHKADSVALIEYGYGRGIDDFISFIRELEAELPEEESDG